MNFSGARVARHVDAHVGERIRERRTMLGLTQEQVAQALQISYQQVQKYETGANRVSAGRLFELAQLFQCDIGVFFEGFAGARLREEPLPHGGRNRVTIELVRNFLEIEDSDVRNSIATLVKNLSARRGADSEPV